MGEIARQRGLADAVGADQHDVGRLLEEVERHQAFEGGPIGAGGPGPIEVAERLEAPDVGTSKATLQAAPGSPLLFPVEQGCHPAAGEWPPPNGR